MKILLIGEASFLHNTLKKGLLERGHRVLTMSDGNGWHDAPRDIDLRRDGRWGKFGGLWVVWQLLRHLPQLCGNDVVQIHNYQSCRSCIAGTRCCCVSSSSPIAA